MNLNHNPDGHLLEQIDQRLNSRQPVGHPTVDELADTVPVPRQAFQQALEMRLLAKLETTLKGDTLMTTKSIYVPTRSARQSWLPLTLVTAMLVLVVAVGIILGGGKASPSEVLLAGQSTMATATQVTVTPTGQPTTLTLALDRAAVTIPLRLLTADSYVPGTGGEVEIIGVLPFNTNNPNIVGVPATPMPEGTRLIEKMVSFYGQVLFRGIWPLTSADDESTITFSVPPDDARLLAWLTEQQVMIRLQKPTNRVIPMLPDDTRVINIPIEQLTTTVNLQVGDAVEVYSSCAVTGNVVDCTQPAEEKQANATIIIGEVVVEGRQPVLTYAAIGLGLSPDAYMKMRVLSERGMHFKLVKVDTPQRTPTVVTLPSDKVAIALVLTGDETWKSGDWVDVIADYTYADVGSAPAAFQQVMPSESEQSAQIRQRLVRRVQVVQQEGETITLAVSPEDASILRWALDAQLSIILQASAAITSENPNQQIHSLRFPLDSLSRWTSDDLEVGDRVDVMMGFVLGTDDEITLAFKPYGIYTWGDPFTKGEITAKIYAPSNGKPGADAAFINRVIQGAVVTALQVMTDPVSGRLSDAVVTLELPAGTTRSRVDNLQGYIDAGLPYLLVARR